MARSPVGKSRRPWEKLPDAIDRSVALTTHEEGVIGYAVECVVRNIFRREKNPLKIRILLETLVDSTRQQAIYEASLKEARFKRKIMRERVDKGRPI